MLRQIEADLEEEEKQLTDEYLLQQQQQRPEFLDHLVRSPELRLSPIGYKNIRAYDTTVQELYDKQQQQQQQQNELKQLRASTEKRLLRQHGIEEEDEKIKREELEEQKQKQEEEEEYIKIAISDLINAFEKQAIQQQQQQQKELFVPKEIPLESYAPPPAMPTVLRTTTMPKSEKSYNQVLVSPPSGVNYAPAPFSSPPSGRNYTPTPLATPPSGVNYTPAPLAQQKFEPWTRNEQKFPTNQPPVWAPKRNYDGPSFNNAPRGWQKSAAPAPAPGSVVNTKTYFGHGQQLPYTDF